MKYVKCDELLIKKILIKLVVFNNPLLSLNFI
jgi:hypothetical protein